MRAKTKEFWAIWLKNKNFIKNHVKGDCVLDFGSDTGYFLKKLASKYTCVYGMDLCKPRNLDKKIKFIKIKDLKALRKLQLPVKFDTMICSEVLEHLSLSEIKTTLRFFRKNLKGGRILITVPYKEKLTYVLLPLLFKMVSSLAT